MNRFFKHFRKTQCVIQLALVALLAVAMLLIAGCGDSKSSGEKRVAISFANSSESWKRNGDLMKQQLEADGFIVDIEYADTDTQQNEQILKLIGNNPNCIVIGAINTNTMSETLEKVKEKKIPVIAYDRLIMNSDAVSYLATFDGEAIGEAMGKYIENALNLKSGAGPFTIELFAGDTNDNNAHTFFDTSMKTLKPYLDNGQLVCRSGETKFEQVYVKDWNPDNATSRMEKIIRTYYADGSKIDAILCPNDGSAAGIRKAWANVGYTGGQPIISGLDGDPAAYKAIQEGTQTFTVTKDPEVLVAKCIRMVKAVVEGTQPTLNDVTTYNNGAVTVPAYLCIPKIIDKDNVHEVLK